jgi:threonine dehydratase
MSEAISTPLVTLDDFQAARERIRGVAFHTPLIPCRDEGEVGAWFKPESFQPIGSFKIRGSFNRIAALSEAQRRQGVITHSSGNHAQGVAFSARHFGIPAVIVMPDNAPKVKLDATRSYGAEVVLYDPKTEEREEVSRRLMQGKDWTLVPPFNDPYVIAGQGTISLEILDDLPDVDLIITPIGGGGLISGVAAATKLLKPNVKVIGVEPELAADAQESLRTGRIVKLAGAEAGRTIADGVRTPSLGDITFAHVMQYVDDILTVSEAEIRDATRRLVLKHKLTIEPSGALPYAAYLHHRNELPSARNTVMVLSGGSIDPLWLADLLREA